MPLYFLIIFLINAAHKKTGGLHPLFYTLCIDLISFEIFRKDRTNTIYYILDQAKTSFSMSINREELCNEILQGEGKKLEGKTCLVSGSGNVAQFTVEKLNQLGAKVVTLSDSSGMIHDESGITPEKLKWVMNLKNVRRGRIKEYAEHFKGVEYIERNPADPNPVWNIKADYAFPCATQNEILKADAENLVRNGIKLVGEGANMPCSVEAENILTGNGVLLAPAKAANAGGVAVSGLEMSQNSMRMQWTRERVDQELQNIMKNIYKNISEAAETYSEKNNFVDGANIAGFMKVSRAMLAEGYV